MSVKLQVYKMTLAEKLRAMEALWEDLCQHEKNITVPQWHKDLLDGRQHLVQEGKAKFLDWDAAKRLIARRIS